jgi:outer membrane murein-binding lipoprotein Lpp
MATWVLNDESKVNSYGFRLLNSGLDLERFKANPMMLAMHRDWDLNAVIGRWKNIRIEGAQLLADDEFDMEDAEAKKIAGKVNRGFLNAVSLGFLFLEEFFTKALDGVFELSKSEPYEGSFVIIPSNGSAVRLYASPGVLLSEKEVKLQLSALSKKVELPQESKPKPNFNMEKFTLTAGALSVLMLSGLSNQNDETAVNASIAQLGASLKAAQDGETAAKLALQTMKDAQLTAAKANVTATVDAAIATGKLTADKKESMITLGLNDPAILAMVLESMPGKASLSALVIGVNGTPGDPTNLDEFQKLTHAKQLAFRDGNPEGYKALFA